MSFPGDSAVKNLPANAGNTWVQSLGQEEALEEKIATHFSILAWEIPWTEEPGGLQSVGSQSRTQLSMHTLCLMAKRILLNLPVYIWSNIYLVKYV